mgnify:CR=1 FL=1
MARPKEFERDAVLQKAMEVFWSRGYEATSIGDLVEHLGIGRQSLYDTFGDKHDLYLAALDRYRDEVHGNVLELLRAPLPIRRVLRSFFEASIAASIEHPDRSCMMVSAAAERCPTDRDVKRRFCMTSADLEAAFAERLEKARQDGEIGARQDPQALAKFFVNTLYGLQLSAKGRGDRRTLEQVADVALSTLG